MRFDALMPVELRLATEKLFQFSLWDSSMAREAEGISRNYFFQFSLWDSNILWN